MKNENRSKILDSLKRIYKDDFLVNHTLSMMEKRFECYVEHEKQGSKLTEKDSVLITYGDTLKEKNKNSLFVLKEFLVEYVKDAAAIIHILPMFPYTSDDGFSVVDYMKINPELGTWDDIDALSQNYGLMFDAVVNHISKSSEWFQRFLDCEKPYTDYFITANPDDDYSLVTRPRALPLLTEFETAEGKKYVWTTFSEDQVDLNFQTPDVLVDVLDILVQYAKRGAKFIRLDAIGFLWKRLGTSCMHLEETHEIIKLARKILDIFAPGTFLITETNVPHKDNISYFGNGHDEAHMVYQFPLPPLVMYSILRQNAAKLSEWAAGLEIENSDVTYFNFLSSHDGIGVRPIEGILTEKEKQFLVEATLRHGGKVSYKDNGDGTKSPYELNINYQDALAHPNETDEERISKFLAAYTILLSLQGVPAIYIHSLLGSRNDYYGAETSGIPRRINRERIDVNELRDQLRNKTNRKVIFDELIRRLKIRKEYCAFSPESGQEVRIKDERVFYIVRLDRIYGQKIHVLINVSAEMVMIFQDDLKGEDLLSGHKISGEATLKPRQCLWVLEEQ